MSAPLGAFAQDLPIRIFCASPSAMATVHAGGGKVIFQVQHSDGAADFSIVNGPAATSSDAVLAEANGLNMFTGDVIMDWDQSLCKTDSRRPGLMKCAGVGRVVQPENSVFVPVGLNTIIGSEESLDTRADVFKIVVDLDNSKGNPGHFALNFPFKKAGCILH